MIMKKCPKVLCLPPKAQSKETDAAVGIWEATASSFGGQGGGEPRLGLRCASWATSQEPIQKAKTRGDKLRFHKHDFSIRPYSHQRGHLKHGDTHLPIP